MNKKIVALCLVVVMLAVAVISSTMAYFTDTDEAVNVMVMGNIDIEQNEQKRDASGALTAFDDKGIMLFPGVYDDGALDTKTAGVDSITFWSGVKNSVDKIITVTNKGNAPAYVRTWLAFEVCDAVVHKNFTNEDKLTWLKDDAGELAVENIGGQNYHIAVYQYPDALDAGDTTEASLVEFVIDKMATQDQVKAIGGTYEILALTQAVQVAGFENVDAKAALDEAFGDAHPWGDGSAIAETTEVATAAELSDALAQAASGIPMNITLTGDVVLDADGALTVPAGAKITLDLADGTITGTNTKDAGALIVNNGTLTIKGNDSAEISNTTVNGGALIQNNGTLTLDGGTYVGAPIGATGYPAYAVVAGAGSTLTVEDGTYIESDRGAITTDNGAKVVLNGGKFVVTDAANALTLTCHTICAKGNETVLDIYGGSFENNYSGVSGASVICPWGGQVNVYDGTFSDPVPSTANFNNTGNFQNYMGSGEIVKVYGGTFNDTTVKKHVAPGYSAIDNGDGTYTVGIYAADDTELNSKIASGATEVYLGSGNYIIPDSAQGKEITFIGNGDTVVATQDDGSYEGCDYSLEGATATFENIVINTNSATYTGYARLKATYNNCTINGTYTLYDDSTFNGCTFNVSGDVYNIWTWGAPNATFNGCTFNSDGKAMLLYGGTETVLTLNDCIFNDKGGLSDLKAAVEVGNDYNMKKTLIANNVTVNGYEINDKGINTGTTLWGNKNSMGTDLLNVIVDGVDVY